MLHDSTVRKLVDNVNSIAVLVRKHLLQDSVKEHIPELYELGEHIQDVLRSCKFVIRKAGHE